MFGDQVEGSQQAKQTNPLTGLSTNDSLEQMGNLLPGFENIGTTSQALTGGTGRHTLPDVENPNVPPGMPYYDQGTQNACGTTSLAMIMTYLGVTLSHEDIDNAIRRMDIFTSPNDIVDFARSKGLEAEEYNHGTWDELKSQIDAGHPVEALIESDTSLGGSADGIHWIAITGYETDPATGQEYVIYHDPNWGDDPATAGVNEGAEVKIPVEDFMKMWGNTSLPPGAENFYVAFGKPGETLPPSRVDGMEGALGATDGITNVTNGLNRLYSPDSVGSFVHGIPQFFGGIAQTIGSGVGFGFQWLGQNLNDLVDGIPVVSNILQPFGDALNGVGAVVADVFNGLGEACDDVGGAFESLFDGDFGGFAEGLGNAVVDAVGGVVDAVGDAISAVGDAVSDFFSGW
jgi:hypothetical protein